MTLKKTSEFKREDYIFESPDGDEYEITIVQTSDRRYVEIKRDEDGFQVQWDVEMLLDIADAVRYATQKKVTKSHSLKKPQVTDKREESRSATIQASVEESMKKIESTDDLSAVESFSSSTIVNDITDRTKRSSNPISSKSKIKRRITAQEMI